jgi:hypothetical protein
MHYHLEYIGQESCSHRRNCIIDLSINISGDLIRIRRVIVSRFALYIETVRNLTKAFRNLYPRIHSRLLREKHHFMFVTKSLYILDKTKDMDSHPWFIDYKEGDNKSRGN